MVNPLNVGRILVENLEEEFGAIAESTITLEEEELAKRLLVTIKSYIVGDLSTQGIVKVEKIETEYENGGDEEEDANPLNCFGPSSYGQHDEQRVNFVDSDDDDTEQETEANQISDSNQDPIPQKKKKTKQRYNFVSDNSDTDPDFDFEEAEAQMKKKPESVELEFAKKVLDVFDKKGFKTVIKWFPRVKDRGQIYRYREIVKNQGTKFEKLARISEEVLKKFKEAKERNEYVNTKQFLTWGREAANKVNLPKFKASPSWLILFKRRHGIVQDNMPKGTGSQGPRPPRKPGYVPKPRKPRKKKTEGKPREKKTEGKPRKKKTEGKPRKKKTEGNLSSNAPSGECSIASKDLLAQGGCSPTTPSGSQSSRSPCKSNPPEKIQEASYKDSGGESLVKEGGGFLGVQGAVEPIMNRNPTDFVPLQVLGASSSTFCQDLPWSQSQFNEPFSFNSVGIPVVPLQVAPTTMSLCGSSGATINNPQQYFSPQCPQPQPFTNLDLNTSQFTHHFNHPSH